MGDESLHGRRSWIKLWVGPCLRGTIREELTPPQRWAWIALLLLCGDSPFQPLVCISPEVGYTDEQIAKLIDVSVKTWKSAKGKMVEFDKIEVDDMNVIKIRNWKKYQSEYMRQRPYRTGTEPLKDEPPANASKVEKARYLIRKEVIAYLNEKTGKLYQASAQESIKHINGRITEGAKLEDFKTCIDKKVADWKGTDYEVYLRPSTLFNSEKFWSYVNQNIATDRKRPDTVGKSTIKGNDWKDELPDEERLLIPDLTREYEERVRKYAKKSGKKIERLEIGRDIPSLEYFLKTELRKRREEKEGEKE